MKILVFAGTKNGRLLVEALASDHQVMASSISDYAANLIVKHSNVECIVGKMTIADLLSFVKTKKVDIIIDSTHPYAEEISLNIIGVSKETGIPVIRYERETCISDSEGLHFSEFSCILDYLKRCKGNILFTTGVNEVFSMVESLDKERLYVRIVPMKASIDKVSQAGLSEKSIILKQPPYTLLENLEHIKKYNIKYLVTKDSGMEGNTIEKVMATKELGCQLLVLDRPSVTYATVFYTIEDIVSYLFRYMS